VVYLDSKKVMESIVKNIDCMVGMSEYPDKYFDLVIVDPPYGIGEDGSRNKSRGKLAKAKNYKAFAGNDIEAPPIEYFNELIRISKNQIIWGANHFISRIPLDSSCWIVWDKNNGENDFADCELAWTSFKSAVRKFKFTWNGMLQEDMRNKESRIHPTQKPIALYDWIYSKYLSNGGKVLDTHLGSGSNRIAADKAGNIDFVGFELDKDYFEAQEKRWAEYKKQLTLW
jgi:site-specific DNA-methyltransferase (adenine-specific)